MSGAREYLQGLAEKHGCGVGNLLVLAPANDPFNSGTAGDRAKAEWFQSQWLEAGFSRGVHLRRVHYALLSRGVLDRDGTPYGNTLECWQDLSSCSKAARYLGLVPIDAFDDRRNPPPTVAEIDVEYSGGIYTAGALPDLQFAAEQVSWPRLACSLPSHAADFHLEIWCEKSTMNDVLLPLCQRHQATLVTGLGELSITAVDGLMRRMRARNRPCRVFYISDFDPAGESMPVSVARKAQWMLWQEAEQTGIARDLRIYPLVLTEQQVREYELPRVPIKESERRRGSFESRRGTGATELDALEALLPGELHRILAETLARYRDDTLESRELAVLDRVARQCRAVTAAVHAEFAPEMRTAEAELRNRVAAVNDHLGTMQRLFDQLDARLRVATVETPAWPQAEYPREPESPLFDSTRTYLEQQDRYREFKAGGRPV